MALFGAFFALYVICIYFPGMGQVQKFYGHANADYEFWFGNAALFLVYDLAQFGAILGLGSCSKAM